MSSHALALNSGQTLTNYMVFAVANGSACFLRRRVHRKRGRWNE
jgi:hypothetical protein